MLLADENVPRQVVQAVRGVGWPVLWVQEIRAESQRRSRRHGATGSRRWLDPKIWQLAEARQAAILTSDHGLEADAHEREHHWGLVRLDFTPRVSARHRAIYVVTHLDELWGVDIENRVFVLSASGLHVALPQPGRTRRH